MFQRIITPKPQAVRKPPKDYLGYLEWKQLELRKSFEANPLNKDLFYEWKRWEEVFFKAMELDAPVDISRAKNPYWNNRSFHPNQLTCSCPQWGCKC